MYWERYETIKDDYAVDAITDFDFTGENGVVEARIFLEKLEKILPPVEFLVLLARFVYGFTHREIGVSANLSATRVSTIEKQAIRRCLVWRLPQTITGLEPKNRNSIDRQKSQVTGIKVLCT